MTNADRYKTAKERAEEFFKNVSILLDDSRFEVIVKFCHWLDLEAPEEKLLPCPFCGAACATNWDNGYTNVWCTECSYRTKKEPSKDIAVAAHNRFAKAAKEKEAK